MAVNVKVKNILVTQPKPETDKNPYFDLAKKFNVKIEFRPFIQIEGIPAKGSKEYKGLYNFNAFNEKDVLLKTVDMKNLKFNISVVRIGYRDGTNET